MRIDIKTLTNEYGVITGRGLLNRLRGELGELLENRKIGVVTDSNVAPLYLETVEKALGETAGSYVLEAGERSKNWREAGKLLEWMSGLELTRGDLVVALGGGVVGDMTGFAASVYMRGINYIQLPTTLLAGIDSSVGGKTAVDLPAGKNLVGRVHPPAAVVFDFETLATLPVAELRCGMGEGVKYGILEGGALFSMLEEGLTAERFGEFADLAVRCKKRIVEADEYEGGDRRLLNLGHTLGHAIELKSGFTLGHGDCVAAGIVAVCRAGLRHGLLPPSDFARIEATLKKYGFGPPPYPIKELVGLMRLDKKNVGGLLNLVTVHSIGDCRVTPMTLKEAEEFLLC